MGFLKVLRRTAYLNLLFLNVGEVNDLLASNAEDLVSKLTKRLLDQNREMNRE